MSSFSDCKNFRILYELLWADGPRKSRVLHGDFMSAELSPFAVSIFISMCNEMLQVGRADGVKADECEGVRVYFAFSFYVWG